MTFNTFPTKISSAHWLSILNHVLSLFVHLFDVFLSASISQSDSFNLLRHFIIDLIVDCFQRIWKNRIRFAITVDAASLWKWLHMHTNIFKLQIRVEYNVYNYSHLDPDARHTFDWNIKRMHLHCNTLTREWASEREDNDVRFYVSHGLHSIM